MKKFISFILMFGAMAFSCAFADDTNKLDSSCNAEISIKLKEPTKEINTNKPVIVTIEIKNNSTNEMLIFRMESLPTDFHWTILLPSGKNLSPGESPLSHVAISGMFSRLKPMGSSETDFDLSSICKFNEVGTYKVIVKKQVILFVSPSNRKKCEIASKPLDILVSR